MFLQLTAWGAKINIVRTVIGHHFKLCDLIENDGSIIYKFTTPSTTPFYSIFCLIQSCSKNKNKSRSNPSFERDYGGDEGIRTLETLSRLHDFQSCALDQLGDISI